MEKRSFKKVFTADEVRIIRRLVAEGTARKVIAEDFGVSLETVHRIVRRENFKWVQDDPRPLDQIPEETLREADEMAKRLIERFGAPSLLTQEGEQPSKEEESKLNSRARGYLGRE